jgi:hypothetical protein
MSIIQCGTTSTTALVQTGDTNGNLVIQTGSTPTTAMTVSSSQIVNFNNAPTVGGSPLPSGAMSLISTLTTISGTTSLSWSGLDNTKNYLILFSNLCPVTGGSNLYLRTGNFGGTFYTSGYYQNAYANEYGSTYPATIGNGVGIYLDGELGVSTYSSGSGVGISGSVFISNGPVGNYSNITYTSSFLVGNYSTPSNSNGGGFCISGGQQSFQLIFSSGNMSVNGISSLYQINK